MSLNSELAYILEVESVNDSDIFDMFSEWDSLAQLSIIAIVERDYCIQISYNELFEARTVNGLKELIEKKMK